MANDPAGPKGQIETEREGPICWITFNNSSRMNAFSTAMWAALPKTVSDADADPSVRVLVFRGAGEKAYSAGADISEFGTARSGKSAKDYDDLSYAGFASIMNCTKPTISMIHGYCMGGGMELAMCCDLRYAAHGATFAIPAAKLGVGYDPRWVRPLLATLSASQVKEVLLTGRRFDHVEAQRMGIVSQVFPADTLEDETRALAQTIAENAPLAVQAAKRCVDELIHSPENPDIDVLDQMIAACHESEDYAEGQAAFLEKRKPAFKGK